MISANVYLLIGIAISLLFVYRTNVVTVGLCSLYWLIWFCWSINLIDPFTFAPIEWEKLLNIHIAYRIDGLAKLFVLLISGIGVLIMNYAYIYSQFKPEKRPKLLSLLQIFAISMLAMVLADDMIMLFLAWELTTVTSYLLIQFNSANHESNQAAFISIFTTLMGSLAMLVGFILLQDLSGSWSIQDTTLKLMHLATNDELSLAFYCILFGAMTKSAQFPFHFWLPGAMKAPTPVSAYLHSATMVNAGIYLLARLHPLFHHLSAWYPLLSFFGLSTMLVSSILTLMQDDFKAVLAYTTLFALGAMVYLLGSDQTLALEAFGLFFIFHGIYKAGAFMLIGTIDQEYQTRSLSKLNGIAAHRMPLAIPLIIILAAMSGLPPFFGFTVKEMVYEAKLAGPTVSYFYIFLSLLSSTLVAAGTLRAGWFLCHRQDATLKPSKHLKLGLAIPFFLALTILALNILDDYLQPIVQAAEVAILPGRAVFYADPSTVGSSLLSLLTVISGVGLATAYYLLDIEHRHILFFSFRSGFEKMIAGCLRFGKTLTEQTQEQSMTRQLNIMLLFIIAVLIITMTNLHYQKELFASSLSITLNSLPLLLLIIFTALSVLFSNGFLRNLISLSLLGLGVSFFFIVNGAIDLAITQLLVEILSIVILLITLRKSNIVRPKINIINVANTFTAITFGTLITIIMLFIKTIPFNETLSSFYIDNSLTNGYGKNIVNVILVDFRSFDTFGEVVVIIATAVGIWFLLRKEQLTKR